MSLFAGCGVGEMNLTATSNTYFASWALNYDTSAL
jgi:hypothetical protein